MQAIRFHLSIYGDEDPRISLHGFGRCRMHFRASDLRDQTAVPWYANMIRRNISELRVPLRVVILELINAFLSQQTGGASILLARVPE